MSGKTADLELGMGYWRGDERKTADLELGMGFWRGDERRERGFAALGKVFVGLGRKIC